MTVMRPDPGRPLRTDCASVRFLDQVLRDTGPTAAPPICRTTPHRRRMEWALLLQGRLSEIVDRGSDTTGPTTTPETVLALTYAGRIGDAHARLAALPAPDSRDPQRTFVDAALALVAGSRSQALDLLEQTVHLGRRTAAALTPFYEATFALGVLMHHDAAAAGATIEGRLPHWRHDGNLAAVEWGQTVLGWSALCLGEPDRARSELRDAVRGMQRAGRALQLPLAAALLAEAAARCGDLVESYTAADTAYESACATGFYAGLVRAVRSHPAILSRQRGRFTADDRWHRLIACPSTPAFPSRVTTPAGVVHLRLRPFGPRPDVELNGRPLGIRRLKVLELVACLAAHPGGLSRAELREMLMPEADSRVGANHLRQVTYRFRAATGVTPHLSAFGRVTLPTEVVVTADDVVLEQEAALVSIGPVSARLAQLTTLLELYAGPYLAGSTLPWARLRRDQLEVVREEAWLEIVHLLLDAGRTQEARRECVDILARNELCDPAYRLLARMDGAGRVRGRATRALGRVGLVPGDIRRLVGSPLRTGMPDS